MIIKELPNTSGERNTLTDILFSLLYENIEYTDYIKEIINNISPIGEIRDEGQL